MINVRRANFKDWEFVYMLRTLAEDSEYYFSGNDINVQEHLIFWRHNYKEYWIAEAQETAVAFYGLVNGDFRFAVLPCYRGHGIGSILIKHAIERHNLSQVVVDKNNAASISCFLKNNFYIAKEEIDREYADTAIVLRRDQTL